MFTRISGTLKLAENADRTNSLTVQLHLIKTGADKVPCRREGFLHTPSKPLEMDQDIAYLGIVR